MAKRKIKLIGFAKMSPEERRAAAALGGRSVPAHKRSFSTNPDLARSAGRLGGKAVAAEKRSFSRDHDLASKAGRKGGNATHHKPHTTQQ